MIYDSYIVSQEKDIDTKLHKILLLNKQYMDKSLNEIQRLLLSKKELTQTILQELQHSLKNTPTTQLELLRDKLKDKYLSGLRNQHLQIFLLDRNYIITAATDSFQIGSTLRSNYKISNKLDSLKNIGQSIVSDNFFIDFFKYEIIDFSYMKITKDKYMIVAMVYEDSLHYKQDFDLMKEVINTHIDMFCVIDDKQGNQYYESIMAYDKQYKKVKDYVEIKQKFPTNEHTKNDVINASKLWLEQKTKIDNILHVYIPIFKSNNELLGIYEDLVLQVDLDISDEQVFESTIINKLILFIIIHLVLVFMIFYFTNRYQRIEKKLEKELDKNKELINYNKQFISNTVHQIRTPLAVIMTNISLLESLLDKDIKQYTSQINASINLLSNSYENLSYFITYKNLHYVQKKVNISSILDSRIEFFEHVIKANKKFIFKSIQDNIFFKINDIELERVIDNTIANIIFYCEVNESIIVKLFESENQYIIEFKTNTNKKIKENIFINNAESLINDTSSFGLGIHLIKLILSKYDIKSKFIKEDKALIIKYFFEKGKDK
jgi:uncharacterized membrane-anchored protein YhcB (DUF1043 family)